MIGNEVLQQALIAKANSAQAIVQSLPEGGVREYDYQGTDLTYPLARLQLESQVDAFETMGHCPSQLDFSWYIFSESRSSKECNQIASKFVNEFEGLSFTRNGVKFVAVRILENVPAIREDSRTWRAQVRCQSIVHQ